MTKTIPRITRLNGNQSLRFSDYKGPVGKAEYGQHTEQIVHVINHNPGLRAVEIAELVGKQQQQLGGPLDRLTKSGRVLKRIQDGRPRYYARNYIVPSQTAITAPEAEEPITAGVKLGEAVLKLAKDYYWQTRNDSLHDFMEYAETGKIKEAENAVSNNA